MSPFAWDVGVRQQRLNGAVYERPRADALVHLHLAPRTILMHAARQGGMAGIDGHGWVWVGVPAKAFVADSEQLVQALGLLINGVNLAFLQEAGHVTH